MKKLILTAALFLALSGLATAQTKTTVHKDGHTFTATKATGANNENKGYTPTGYYYVDTDGQTYEIHTHTAQKGEHQGETFCYIQKVSKKTNKPYWKKIDVKPEELKED